jgi:hypothetical protein
VADDAKRMLLGEARKTLGNPKVFGVLGGGDQLSDDRNVVVQVPVGEPDQFGFQGYEYRVVRAIGTLFLDGEFTAVISAGDVL